jgi:hypothetical protein
MPQIASFSTTGSSLMWFSFISMVARCMESAFPTVTAGLLIQYLISMAFLLFSFSRNTEGEE